MKTTIIILLLAIGMRAQRIDDYQKHYMVSVNMSSFFTSTAFYVTKKPVVSALIGLSASFLVGMGKEYVWDGYMHKGVKDMNDLDADGRGSAVGAFFSFGSSDMLGKRKMKIDSLKYKFN